ncbi:hypothetical protein CLFO_27280 [Clostridium formicaceticum]|uniref:Dockerin type 1 n=1 Tax=Clostridium formicaceticum TaxID=1497 RepID=A0AAC9RMH0_9CLOT|nr:hypothetical protein BJL90_18845 [Clostridium formicaceticum]ARE88327.1 hypothetical protein CLFO_27280 [Clostridium formicaceticum]
MIKKIKSLLSLPKRIACFILIAMLLYLGGCQNQISTVENQMDSSTISLKKTAITTNDPSVSIKETTATISSAGTYVISGTLEDGQIIVNAATAGTVTLVLNNADITFTTGAPIYIQQAKNVVITLAEGTTNRVSDGSAHAYSDTEIDAVIYSKEDLVINGQGTLTVNARYKDGISSRDTLLIEGGKINITAANHGIKGKDYLIVNDGIITVHALRDGMKATNDTQISLGYVEINGGNINITAKDDGISAVSRVTVNKGTISIDTENNGIKSEDVIDLQGGTITIVTDDDGLVSLTQTGTSNAHVTVNGTVLSF